MKNKRAKLSRRIRHHPNLVRVHALVANAGSAGVNQTRVQAVCSRKWRAQQRNEVAINNAILATDVAFGR